MDVDRRWLHRRKLRNDFGCVEPIGRRHHLHGSNERAITGDPDADGQVRDGHKQDCGGNDHRYGPASGGCVGNSDECFGADRTNEKSYCYGNERPTE